MIEEYYALAKPGIIYGNLVTTAGGFLLAARGRVDLPLFFSALAGISFVMASACVFNNYIDRDIDRAMERTKGRALAAGRIKGRAALVYAACLGILGFLILARFANFLTAEVALVGFFFYVFVYSMWSKRRTVYATLVGSVAGAAPPVVGYAAAADRLDGGALILFAILVLWQMPHFYAIALYRSDEYAAAGIPVRPLQKGIRSTKASILLYIIAFIIAAFMLAAFGYAGRGYLTAAALLGLAWLGLCIRGFWTRDDKRWARTMFFVSLAVLVLLFIAISVGSLASRR